ncbi:MAG: Ankyrin repeat (3 copies) [Solimicrobium sp.]|jgi:hypothetical protein|nr:Ankyrin repeat (3 copies) [Solimicrobium sp.]
MIGNIVGRAVTNTSSAQHPTVDELRLTLFKAVLNGNEQEAKNVLDTFPDLIHAKTKTGNKSLLHIASANGHESICRLLLEKGHESNPVSDSGKTPYSCTNNKTIRFLLAQHHKNILCEKFYTFNKTSESVYAADQQDFKEVLNLTSPGLKENATIAFSSMSPCTSTEHITELPHIVTVFREQELMMPYFGELLMVHENEFVENLSKLADSFIEKKTPLAERIEVNQSSFHLFKSYAYSKSISYGIERFPFLRDLPEESDRPDIAEAKKMFLAFQAGRLLQHSGLCSREQYHFLKTQSLLFQSTMPFVLDYLGACDLKINDDNTKSTRCIKISEEISLKYETPEMK